MGQEKILAKILYTHEQLEKEKRDVKAMRDHTTPAEQEQPSEEGSKFDNPLQSDEEGASPQRQTYMHTL